MKDWQEGLRALLPNINISFGSQQTSVADTRPNTSQHTQHQKSKYQKALGKPEIWGWLLRYVYFFSDLGQLTVSKIWGNKNVKSDQSYTQSIVYCKVVHKINVLIFFAEKLRDAFKVQKLLTLFQEKLRCFCTEYI